MKICKICNSEITNKKKLVYYHFKKEIYNKTRKAKNAK